MKNIPYKTTCTNILPDDEHVMFDTLEDTKNLIKTLICAFVGLRHTIVPQCTVKNIKILYAV